MKPLSENHDLWTIERLISWTSRFFGQKGIDSPRLDAELLLAHVMGKQRIYLYTHYDEIVNPEELALYKELIRRRIAGVCTAALTGEKDFMGLTFHVGSQVLIPRPDTETWVEKMVQRFRTDELYVADLGTGSGAVLISFLYYCRSCRGVGVDLSPEALKTAEENGRLLKVDDRIQWKLGDYLEPLGDDAFDGILTNPPYIAREEMAALSEEVRHEPVMALDGGPDGLDFYRKLAMEGWKSLKSGGFLAAEIGEKQTEDVLKLLKESGRFGGFEVIQDLSGADRAIFCKRM